MVGAITGLSAGAIAAIGTVASVGATAYELSQQGSEQSTALGIAQTTQGEQQYYNNLLQQLIANPSSVSSLPGYQFQLSQGSAAVADQMAASGFAGSGNEGAALTEFGQGLASSFYGQQAQLLASLSGVTSASSPASDVSAATGASSLSTATLNNLFQNLGITAGLFGSNYFGSSAGTPASTQYPGGATGSGLSAAQIAFLGADQ